MFEPPVSEAARFRNHESLNALDRSIPDELPAMESDLEDQNPEKNRLPMQPAGAGGGDAATLHDLAPLVYSELRALAAAFMRAQSPGHTLQPTALVNEAYLRLAKSSPEALRSRSHFLAVAAKAMRHVLINHAHTKNTAKRGGSSTRVSLHSIDGTGEFDHLEILAIHEALERLEELDPRRATVVEAKVFGGLTNDEVAEVLGVSTTTVESEWRTGRAWLAKELRPQTGQMGAGGSSG